ncbi:MAG: hypothetical protein ABII27_04480 [bacterium]
MNAKNKGSILILTLWIMAILSLLAINIAGSMSYELYITGRFIDSIKSFQILQAGIRKAALLTRIDDDTADSLKDIWSNNPKEFKKIQVGEGYLTISRKNSGETEDIVYGLIDESRKLNINTASKEILKSVDGLEEIHVHSIIDWRDEDDLSLPMGAENSYYESLPNPYKCKNSPFESLDELLLVRGFSPELLSKVKDKLTVFSSGQININTCTFETLKSIGLDDNTIQIVIDYRNGNDAEEGTEDDRIFTNPKLILSELLTEYQLSEGESAQITGIIDKNILCANTEYFQMNIEVELNKEITNNAYIIFNRKNGEIVYWDEEY